MDEGGWKNDEHSDQHNQLIEIRSQIDAIDLATASLLEQRLELARRAGGIKNELQLPIKDSERESEVLERVSALSTDEEIVRAIRTIYRAVIMQSKKLQGEAEQQENGPLRAAS